jgi:uncharacterized coiled-coil DUF342 family protein
MDNFATTANLLSLRDDFRKEIARLATKEELRQETSELRQETRELRKDLDQLRQDLVRLRDELRKEIELMGSNLTVRVGGMLVVAVGVLATLMRLL